MKIKNIGLKHIALLVVIALVLFGIFRHYSYIFSLSPLLKSVYDHKEEFPEKDSIWVLDPSQVVNEYIHIGITEEEVKEFIRGSGMLISPNTRRSPSEIEKYDSRIVAYQYMRSGFAGWHALLAGSYTLRIAFNFNNGVLEKVDSVLIKNSL